MSKFEKYHSSYADEPFIAKILEAAKGFYGLADARQHFTCLCNCSVDFVQLDSNVYRYKDYYIELGKRFILAGHANVLMAVTRFELSCLPTGIAVIWLDNDEDLLLITKINACSPYHIAPYNALVSALPLHTRQALLADTDTMLEEGYALLALSEEKNGWYLVEDRIIFSSCELAYVPENAKAAYRSRILKILCLN